MAEQFRIGDDRIRLIELFAGIGSQAMALRDIGARFTHYRVVEFDKYPIASYNAIHGTDFVPLDITKISYEDLGIEKTDKYKYVVTYSFPCQDLSVAGHGAGMSKGSGTRSGLLWEFERLLSDIVIFGGELPQVLIMENVPQVHGKKHVEDFNEWLSFLESLGYKNFWSDLNAADFGVAQSRKRCFCVSLLGDYEYTFPSPIELTKTMEDYLEEEVPEKYYVTSDKAWELINKLVIEDKIPLPEDEEEPVAVPDIGIQKGVIDEELMNLLMGDPEEESPDAWMRKMENYDLIEKAAEAIVKESDYSLAAKVLDKSEYEICEYVIREGDICTVGEEVLKALVDKKRAEILPGVSPT